MSTRVVRKASSSGGAPLALTNAPFSLVGLAAAVVLTSGGGAFVYGAWSQLKANVGANANGYGLVIVTAQGAGGTEGLVQIGTGAGGSEVPIVEFRVPTAAGQSAYVYDTGEAWPFVASGARVAARWAANAAGQLLSVDGSVVALAVAATLV